jgi:hypothetical protein
LVSFYFNEIFLIPDLNIRLEANKTLHEMHEQMNKLKNEIAEYSGDRSEVSEFEKRLTSFQKANIELQKNILTCDLKKLTQLQSVWEKIKISWEEYKKISDSTTTPRIAINTTTKSTIIAPTVAPSTISSSSTDDTSRSPTINMHETSTVASETYSNLEKSFYLMRNTFFL